MLNLKNTQRILIQTFTAALFILQINQSVAAEPRIAPVHTKVAAEAQATLSGNATSTGQLNITATMANHPELSKAWIGFATYLLRNSTLPPRERELLIMRTGWLCQAEYEWGRHHLLAIQVGLTEEEVERIKVGASSKKWSQEDRMLIIAADELHETQKISDATWKVLSQKYSKQQLMDIVFTVGQYNLVAMAINSFGVTLEEGIAGF